jgi:hypothetical protein
MHEMRKAESLYTRLEILDSILHLLASDGLANVRWLSRISFR